MYCGGKAADYLTAKICLLINCWRLRIVAPHCLGKGESTTCFCGALAKLCSSGAKSQILHNLAKCPKYLLVLETRWGREGGEDYCVWAFEVTQAHPEESLSKSSPSEESPTGCCERLQFHGQLRRRPRAEYCSLWRLRILQSLRIEIIPIAKDGLCWLREGSCHCGQGRLLPRPLF